MSPNPASLNPASSNPAPSPQDAVSDAAARSQATVAITAGRSRADGSLAPVLWNSTTYEQPSIATARKLALSPRSERFYARYGNPSVAAFEEAMAELEGAECARAFGSGMGAVSAVVLALCSTGGHVVATRQIFGGTRQLLQGPCARFGIDVTFVDGTEPGAMAAAVIPGRTNIVLAESPANPRLDLVDLDELGSIVGPFKVLDSTLATPLGQQPHRHGIDLVIHSATKAIAGHNDAMLGVVTGERDLIDWVSGFAALQGATASPHDANSGLRGLRTLSVRLRQQAATAAALADFLQERPEVSATCYPGLSSHPQHELAKRQLSSFGGLVTFDLAGGVAAGERFVESLKLARHATSLGGPETLVTHPASTTHAALDPDEQAEALIGPGTIRVSCGLEETADVIADFTQALS